MWANLAKQWFLIALAICFLTGYWASGWLQPLMDAPFLRSGIVFAVMWAMGVTLRAETIRSSLARPIPALLAITINILLVPLLVIPTMWVLPENLFGGLFIASLIPCTLASASVWTRKAGGDDSIAMMTTVVTNLACLCVVPVGLALVLAQRAEVAASEQVVKLAMVVVAPLVLAQFMRRTGFDIWADRNRSRLSMFGQLGILVMVVFGAVASSAKIQGVASVVSPSWISVAILVAAAIFVHVTALLFGVAISRSLRMSREHQIAIGISGSQKTLMIGLQIAIDCGFSVVPMLVYHLSQLVIDTVVADRWKRRTEQLASTVSSSDE